MFSGIGGFEYGIENYHRSYLQGKETQNLQGERSNIEAQLWRFECVGYSEIDKYAIQIYEKHFPDHINYGDATKIRTEELPEFDLLVGGFPCQAFSVAGKQRGFCDTRGTLFFEISRILEDKRPRYFLLENVKGLLGHDKGKTFQKILEVLTDIGYRVQWQVLNSKDFGVPQNRERVFIIGYLRGNSRQQIFPITGNGGETNKLNQLNQLNNPVHSFNRVFGTDGIAPCFRSANGNKAAKVAVPVLTPDRVNKRQNGRRFKENGDPSFTLTSQDRYGVMTSVPERCEILEENISSKECEILGVPYRIRRLTPTECERLQGFPDGWTKIYDPLLISCLIKYGTFGNKIKEISDTQRYKCLGNAVTTNVISTILSKIFNDF